MVMKDDPLSEIMQEVTASLTTELRSALTEVLEKQLTQSLTQSLLESEFYRRISKDMRSGLRRLYKEVSVAQNAAAEGSSQDKARADKLFHDASEQLTAVLQQTEAAANTIMTLVEKHMSMQAESSELLERPAKAALPPRNGSASMPLMPCLAMIWSP